MKFKTLTGKLREFPVTDWRIDWGAKSLSIFQKDVKDFLFPYWKHDFVCEEFRVGRMSIDIVNITRKIAIEVQGRQHSTYIPFLSGSRQGYLNQLKRDLKKEKFCEVNGFKLIEIHPENMPLTKEWLKENYDVIL